MAFEKLNSFFGINDEETTSEQYEQTETLPENDKVVSMNTEVRNTGASKISIFQPRVYSDAKTVAKQLLSNKAVVVNFNNINEDQAKRVVDFLTGTVFAIDGEIKRVGEKIFLCTPPKFEIDGSIPDLTE
ncbi:MULTISPECIES: cell division protein SepF [Lactobacillaceae]|uniref:cell division protein SepF n=1 Tax=Lactobacillaceae TaxID=33958 RepID=UPI000C1B7763|nr:MULTISPECIES: cell division protein SepF [Lactobacillaceae]